LFYYYIKIPTVPVLLFLNQYYTGGICNINNMSFNVFCYAEDFTDVTNKYITELDLQLNPSKTECTIFGNCNLDPDDEWMLNGVKLKESDGMNYLGVSL
jgi:hypothetical protein